MSEFVTVAKVEEIPPGTGKTVEVNGVWIALFNVDGSFFAVDNTCPHAGGPIGEGSLSGEIVDMPMARMAIQRAHRPAGRQSEFHDGLLSRPCAGSTGADRAARQYCESDSAREVGRVR